MSDDAKRPARRGPAGIDEQLRRAIRDATDGGDSLRGLAREAGIPASALTRFVAGTRDLNLATAAAIASTLGLTLGQAARPRRGR